MNRLSAISLITTITLLTRALSFAPRSSSQVISRDDRKGRNVDQNRNAGDRGGGLQQAMDVGVCAEERRSIAGREPRRELDADAADQGVEVVAPGDSHGDVPDGVFEDQIPTDDPRHQLAERGIAIRVRRSGLRNHRRQLRVTERRQRAGAAQEQEREDQRRAGAVADDRAVRRDLARRRGANCPEDAGADDRADRQHDQVAGAEDALQRMPAVGLVDEEGGNRLPTEELRHKAGILPASRAGA